MESVASESIFLTENMSQALPFNAKEYLISMKECVEKFMLDFQVCKHLELFLTVLN